MLAGGDSLRVDGTSALAPRALEPNPLATPEPGPAPRFKPYLVPTPEPLPIPEGPPPPSLLPFVWPAGVALFGVWTVDQARRILTGDVWNKEPREALSTNPAPDREWRAAPKEEEKTGVGDNARLWWAEFKGRFLSPQMSADPDPTAQPAEPADTATPAADPPAKKPDPFAGESEKAAASEAEGDALMREGDEVDTHRRAHLAYTEAINILTALQPADDEIRMWLEALHKKAARAAEMAAQEAQESGDSFTAATFLVLQVEALLGAKDHQATLGALRQARTLYEGTSADDMAELVQSMENTALQFRALAAIFNSEFETRLATLCYDCSAQLYGKVASYYETNIDRSGDGLGLFAHGKMIQALLAQMIMLETMGKNEEATEVQKKIAQLIAGK